MDITPDRFQTHYPNIFAPAGITFAVWGLIYFLLACYILYQLGLFKSPDVCPTQNIAYGLVLIWAYLGILIKHTGVNGFNGKYPIVIIIVIACIAVFIAAAFYISVSKSRRSLKS